MRRRLLVALLASSGAACLDDIGYLGPPRADHVTLNATPRTLVVGDTLRLTAVARKYDGTPMTRPIGFSSSDARRATVSKVGLVRGVSPGAVRITASSDGESAHLRLVVQRAPSPP